MAKANLSTLVLEITNNMDAVIMDGFDELKCDINSIGDTIDADDALVTLDELFERLSGLVEDLRGEA